MPRRTVRRVIAASTALVILCGGLARADDDWDAVKPAANMPGGGALVQRATMQPENFDRWVFGGSGTDDMQRRLESLLALQIDSVTRTCGLSDAQREKLDMAGHGDLKRLMRTADRLRDRMREVGQDQQKFNEIAREVSPLQMKLQTGVFGESSLYQKVLKEMLDRGQSLRYDEQDRKRRQFRYEAKIELVMSNLETTLPLRAEQRQRLVKLLLDETEPPKKFGTYDYYYVQYRLSKLEEAKLKPLFDEAQWQTMKRVLEQSQRMDGMLRSNGYLP